MLPTGSTNLSDNFFHFGVRIVIFGTFFIGLYINLDHFVIGALIVGEFLFFLILLQFTSVTYSDGNLLVMKNFKKGTVPVDDIDKLEIGGWPLYLVRINLKHESKVGQEIIFCASPALIIGIRENVEEVLKEIQSHIHTNKRATQPHQPVPVSTDVKTPVTAEPMQENDSPLPELPMGTILIGVFLLLILYAIYSMIRG